MQCLKKVRIPDPIAIQKQGFGTQEVSCGSCLFCLANRRSEWSFRLNEEVKTSESAHFLTLTYAEEHLPTNKYGLPTLHKRDLQAFWKRLREHNLNYYYKHGNYESREAARRKLNADVPVRYYSVGEYGTEGGRPHYHAIIFNLQPTLEQKIESIWGMGMVDVAKVEPASINYVTGYVMSKDEHLPNTVPPYNAMSNGLGAGYLRNSDYHLKNESFTVRAPDGSKQKLPRYYREKIFTTEDTSNIMEKLVPQLTYAQKIKIERIRALGNLSPAQYEYDQKEAKKLQLKKQLSKSKKL